MVTLVIVLKVGWLAEDEGLIELVKTEAYIRGEDPSFGAVDPSSEEPTCERVFTVQYHRCHVGPLCTGLCEPRFDLCQVLGQLLVMCLEFFRVRPQQRVARFELHVARSELFNAACRTPLLEVIFSVAVRIAASMVLGSFFGNWLMAALAACSVRPQSAPCVVQPSCTWCRR